MRSFGGRSPAAGMQSRTLCLPAPRVTRVQRHQPVRGVMVTTIVVRTVMVYGRISGTSWSMTEERRPGLRIQRRSEYCNRHNQQERIPGQHRVSFLSFWTANKLPLFGANLEIMGKQSPKKLSPGVPARAKTIFPVIDRSCDSTRGTIGSLYHLWGHRTIRPAAQSRVAHLRRGSA
jgi:hypothetical protein